MKLVYIEMNKKQQRKLPTHAILSLVMRTWLGRLKSDYYYAQLLMLHRPRGKELRCNE